MRELILDDMLPRGLAEELVRRGRRARALAELGLEHASDERAAAVEGVLVTADAATARHRPPGTTVALVTARAGAPRRDAVHRHAHQMASQRPGSSRRYG